ncbi:MAG: hypothetical protein ACI35P_15385 [Bacillus sp. (in: firmicutes)]
MSQMISVASGFQYSVNIGFDLNNDEKLKNFIPTQTALDLLEEILTSTSVSSTERSRVLIGAYGKGKSHIVLMILSMLMKKNLALFEKVVPRIDENPRLRQLVDIYYEGENKILPIVITGSNTSLTQAFLNALQRTLSENDMLDIMPETNYKAAVSVIRRWKKEFPDTYRTLEEMIDVPVAQFENALEEFDIAAYEKFERLYPQLTAGSVFNPFLGFDVVDLYEQAAKSLKAKGYTGIYVVYDEFSKFLEANIVEASMSDTKMLQDFAEKCNRSGNLQLHLMLICHKEISNYIDKLPKQKVDGWRGVSERFKHVRMNNNFAQTYEIVSTVIRKDPDTWHQFCNAYSGDFSDLVHRYEKQPIFADIKDSIDAAIYGGYPLAPVSMFVLPRLSEKVAQNERTLFTFLSAEGNSTLSAFLDTYHDDSFTLITPDVIYDYFSPLLKKEAYGSNIHSAYILTESILQKIDSSSLGSKLIKTISLIYILEQFECLEPTREDLIGIYSTAYEVGEIDRAIKELIDKEFVIYLKRSNNYLRLKQSSGIDIRQQIADLVSTQFGRVSVKDSLNKSNFDNYMYPARYNDERDMTRYFSFEFIEEDEVTSDVDWAKKSSAIKADGVIYGILLHSESSVPGIIKTLQGNTTGEQCIFVVPKHYTEIEEIVREYTAAITLRERAIEDPVLFDEYDVVVDDLNEVITEFVSAYTHPEEYKSMYLCNGIAMPIHRKASLTELMSSICDNVFGKTPIVNNEAVNKNEITTVAANSRNKIVAALLRNDLEPGLGLSGNGQEVSIMRSTLVRTGIWEDGDLPSINLHPTDPNMENMLGVIEKFILQARNGAPVNFQTLYDQLMLPAGHIGLRKGLIPIYLAAVIHEYKKQIVLVDRYGQVQTTVDTLVQINADPSSFALSYLDWDTDKEEYVGKLAELFESYIVEAEKSINFYDYVANAMKRWFLSLPKYSKDIRRLPDGSKVDKRYSAMTKAFRQNPSGYELIFSKLPEAFGYAESSNPGIAENVILAKQFYDHLIDDLKMFLITKIKETFILPQATANIGQMSLASVITDWCESLDPKVFEQLFPDGTNKCLDLFRNITNDEDAFVTRLAKIATDLRIEDWDSAVIDRFFNSLEKYKKTAAEFVSEDVSEHIQGTNSYQISYVNSNGTTVTKRFDKVEVSGRSKLLYNQIMASLDAMGHSISEQEKRQILMEVLKKLC